MCICPWVWCSTSETRGTICKRNLPAYKPRLFQSTRKDLYFCGRTAKNKLCFKDTQKISKHIQNIETMILNTAWNNFIFQAIHAKKVKNNFDVVFIFTFGMVYYVSIRDQTYKKMLCPFSKFWPLLIYILQLFFRFTFLFVPSYLHIYTDTGRPKKCRNIYKLNKYKREINTTKQIICLIS